MESGLVVRTFSVNKHIDEQLVELKNKSGKSMNKFLRYIVESYIMEQELLKDKEYFPPLEIKQ